MTKTFAVPDLHGRADILRWVIGTIEEEAPKRQSYKVVFLGDYVDRGPDSNLVIARLMEGPKAANATWICLKGNHEEMMLAALSNAQLGRHWIENGGDATVASYNEKFPIEHLDWIKALPTIHHDEHRVFVHGWVDPDLDLDRQNDHEVMWRRYPKGDPGGYRGRFVVHGHTPSTSGPHQFSGRIALDTLAWSTGRIPIAVFDNNQPGPPPQIIEVVLPPACRPRA